MSACLMHDDHDADAGFDDQDMKVWKRKICQNLFSQQTTSHSPRECISTQIEFYRFFYKIFDLIVREIS